MGIERMGPRLSIEAQLSRNPVFRNRLLALEIKDGASGRLLRAEEVLAAGVKGIGGVIDYAAARIARIIKPELLNGEMSVRIMKTPVTVEMFRQFVEESGYKIVDESGWSAAAELIALLRDPSQNDKAITYVSYQDATAFIAWRKEITGQDLRMPTEAEWLKAKKVVGHELSGPSGVPAGTDLREWTQTKYSACSDGGTMVARSLQSDGMWDNFTGFRSDRYTFRLVEDK